MADKYFVNGGVDNLYATSGNWSLTDGGAGGAGVPSSSEATFFTANSPNCSVTGSRAALSANHTGYTGTFTMTSGTLTISGSLTLASGATYAAGTGVMVLNGTGTITSNGKTMPWPVTLQGATITFTLGDNAKVSGLVTLGSGTNAVTINGAFNLECTGGLRYAGTSGLINGTATFKLTATQTVDAPSVTTGRISNLVNIDAGGGTITVTAPIYMGNIAYNSGTVIWGNTWASGGVSGIKSQRVFNGGVA